MVNSVAKNILRQRIYSVSLDYFCSDKSYPTQSGVPLTEDIQILLKFWTTMHQDRKHIKTSAVASELDGTLAETNFLTSYANTASDTRSISSEFIRSPTNNNLQSGSMGTNTLGKRSTGTADRHRRPATALMSTDTFVKDYTKKR